MSKIKKTKVFVVTFLHHDDNDLDLTEVYTDLPNAKQRLADLANQYTLWKKVTDAYADGNFELVTKLFIDECEETEERGAGHAIYLKECDLLTKTR